MIEVEVRGRLPESERLRLRTVLQKEGELIETQDREMILIRGYPGYDENPLTREVDVRLRNTDGECEIMLKRKTGENNVARSEVALKLQDSNLDTAKEIFKALGFPAGLWMRRKKEVYRYRDIEWSLVDNPEDLGYFEAEQEIKEGENAEPIRQLLTKEAEMLGLTVFEPEAMKDFIFELDRRINKEISW